jgi:hypothetical protein
MSDFRVNPGDISVDKDGSIVIRNVPEEVRERLTRELQRLQQDLTQLRASIIILSP